MLPPDGCDTVQSATGVLEDVGACHHGPEERLEGIGAQELRWLVDETATCAGRLDMDPHRSARPLGVQIHRDRLGRPVLGILLGVLGVLGVVDALGVLVVPGKLDVLGVKVDVEPVWGESFVAASVGVKVVDVVEVEVEVVAAYELED